MKLFYVFHDCFILSFNNCTLIFDYWRDITQKVLSYIDPSKDVYVLVSHHHQDHFNREIFHWQDKFPVIKYILSNDTAKYMRRFLSPKDGSSPIVSPDKVFSMKAGDVYSDEKIYIKAYGSTDIGVSYFIQHNNSTVFHAGDCNAWISTESSTKKQIISILKQFHSKIDPLSREHPRLTLAMFPVDPRLGGNFWIGAKEFLSSEWVDHFVPMHFALATTEKELERDATLATNFDNFKSEKCSNYHAMIKPFDEIEIDE